MPLWGGSDCADLGPADCGARADCGFIFAAPLRGESCLGEMEPVGCADLMSDCQGEPSAEEDLNGTCWYFRDACRPTGWSSAEGLDQGCSVAKVQGAPSCSTDPIDCESLDAEACRSETACQPVYARPFDDIDACVGPAVVVACSERGGRSCNGQSASVRHHADCWLFVDTCIPDAWRTELDGGLAGCGIPDVWSAPACG